MLIDIGLDLPSDRSMHGFHRALLLPALAAAILGCTERPAPPPFGTFTGSTVVVPVPPPPPPEDLKELPPVETDNKSLLVAGDPSTITVRASSEYPGWPATNATDGNIKTSWYSNRDDSAAKGASPFLQLEFRVPVVVRRVTVLGNRDPAFLNGYTIIKGRIDIYDSRERLLASMKSDGTGNRRDFDFKLETPAYNARMVRFTSLADEGTQNQYGDVAIAEIQIE